jgi:4-aminobutyrate aminotransferase-like enzyme
MLFAGKPLANGYPLAVVVTRSSIAAHLDPEALSHYKCDNVAAAIGLSVIRTIRSESLIQNATNVGTFLREGLRSLAADHQNIGIHFIF